MFDLNMYNFITVLALITALFLVYIGRKKKNNKLTWIGLLILVCGIIVVAPDFIKGFVRGFTEG